MTLPAKEQAMLTKVATPLKKSSKPADTRSALQKRTQQRQVNQKKPAVMMNDY